MSLDLSQNHLMTFEKHGHHSLGHTFVQHGVLYSATGKCLTNQCDKGVLNKVRQMNNSVTRETAHVMLQHSLQGLEAEKLRRVEAEMAREREIRLRQIEQELADTPVIGPGLADFDVDSLFDTTPIIEDGLDFDIPALPPEYSELMGAAPDLAAVRRPSPTQVKQGLTFQPVKSLI